MAKPLDLDGSNRFKEWTLQPTGRAWIATASGEKFYLLNPTPETIHIGDIAHALAMACRWTGHTKYHYSVAQHSYYCSLLVKPKFAASALLHDASEAYLGDMNRPLKYFTRAGVEYRKIEERVEEVIYRKFGLPYPMPAEVKEADDQMLYAEKFQLLTITEATRWEALAWSAGETQAPITIERWTPRRAKKMFLKRFAELYNLEDN